MKEKAKLTSGIAGRINAELASAVLAIGTALDIADGCSGTEELVRKVEAAALGTQMATLAASRAWYALLDSEYAAE